MNEAASQRNERLIAGSACRFYIEISPLLDTVWTGIPMVAANLAREFLKCPADTVEFFFDNRLVSRGVVEDALRRGSGLYLNREVHTGRATIGKIGLIEDGSPAVGLYLSAKRGGGIFPIEISVVHDLSTLLVPQFHTLSNSEYHMESLINDLETNDLTVCVSNATLSDIECYLGYPRSRLLLAPNGVAWPDWYADEAENTAGNVEPYLYVLSTLEPRKNLAVVINAAATYPEILARYRLVVSGTPGWDSADELLPPATRALVQSGRLSFTGYVSDFTKYALLRHAAATIYPSFLEGFGLPVLESLSVGTPCIASVSSSIPEVGGDVCRYIDPFSPIDLYRAVAELWSQSSDERETRRAMAISAAAKFTWENMFKQIVSAVAPIIRGKSRRAISRSSR